MAITKEQIQSVKGRGFLRNRGTDCFSGRVVSIAGIYSAQDLSALSECANKYGNGKVIFTSRLSAEVVGGTGAKVRPITACKGTTCVFGNIDTHSLAKVFHEKFYVGMREVKLPHKFKIGIGGCPNSCMKPSLNDVGVEGCKSIYYDSEKCKGCKKCSVSEACPSRAVSVVDGKAVKDLSKCTGCGVCVGKCPFDAFPKTAESVCRVYVGGTWGKTQRMGTPLRSVYRFDEVAGVVEKVMLWYKENGFEKERLGAAIDRIGIDALESAISDDSLLIRKEEILALEIKTK